MVYDKIVKKLLILGFCTILIVLIANIDENTHGYSPTQSSLDDSITPNPVWMKSMAFRMEKRKKELEKNCKLSGLNIPGNDSLHRPNEWEFLINQQYRLIWCNVFKAASTSWMYNFNILAGYKPQFLHKTKQVPLQLARKKYPRPSLNDLQKALNDSTSFLIVRHPFERLLSAYRDKIEYAIPHTYHYKIGNLIVSKYRMKAKNKERIKFNKERPTFSEFVQYLIDLNKNKSSFDMHWIPITEFCTPCQIRFDVIMKFETLEDDQNYLIQSRKLQKLIKPQWKNPSKGKWNTYNLTEKYYSQLTQQQIEELFSIYRYDFQLFNYAKDGFLKYGLPNLKKIQAV